jgi:sensor histidine kinase regulating citrate/malate metabolism
MLAAIVSGIRATQHIPFDWKFSIIVFVFSAMALSIAMLVASRSHAASIQQQGSQIQSAATNAISASPSIFDVSGYPLDSGDPNL